MQTVALKHGVLNLIGIKSIEINWIEDSHLNVNFVIPRTRGGQVRMIFVKSVRGQNSEYESGEKHRNTKTCQDTSNMGNSSASE